MEKYRYSRFVENPFDDIKSKLNIMEVAEYYGIIIVPVNKAICPFHDDHHPSLSFKNNKFKCFACGIGGTAIDLVMNMFNVPVFGAAKRLNKDFNLEVFEPLDKFEICELKNRREERIEVNAVIQLFDVWRDYMEQWFFKVFKLFKSIKKNFVPRDYQQPSSLWIMALNNIEHIEQILEIFASNDREKILEEYTNIKNYQSQLLDYMERF